MSTYNYLLHKYQKAFNDKEIPLNTIKAFLFELCNDYQVNLYLDIDKEAKKEVEEAFEKGIKRLLNNEPMNYVLGYCYFYGYKLLVHEGAFIPRYETEELVGLILGKYDEYYKGKKVDVCDVGTGSGAIGIALKKEEPMMNVIASDISLEALEVAKENAKLNNADVTYLCGSMLEPYIDNNIKVDILVSNPPYIPSAEVLDDSVKDYEPHLALFGGEDGLKFYRIIFENAHKIVRENGMLFFEIGYDQKERLIKLAKEYFKEAKEIEVYKDLNGKNRMLMIRL